MALTIELLHTTNNFKRPLDIVGCGIILKQNIMFLKLYLRDMNMFQKSKVTTLLPFADPPIEISVSIDSKGNAWLRWTKPTFGYLTTVFHYDLKYLLGPTDLHSPLLRTWNIVKEINTTTWSIPKTLRAGSSMYMKIRTINDRGAGNFSSIVTYNKLWNSKPLSKIELAFAIGIPIIVSLSMVISAAFLLRRRSRFAEKIRAYLHLPMLLPEELETVPKINRKNIIIKGELGSGEFGKVFDGSVIKFKLPTGCEFAKFDVAFKTLGADASYDSKTEFLKEATIASKMNHENVIKLLALCVEKSNIWLMFEKMEGGDMGRYLKTVSNETLGSAINWNIMTENFVRLMGQILSGCEYIEWLDLIHRDIAARNCLISSVNLGDCTIKLTDFGLTRGIMDDDHAYYRLANSLVPIRWSSPEVVIKQKFSSKSDVWSFGVTIWEFFMLGSKPYFEIEQEEEVIKIIGEMKTILPQPTNCPDSVYGLMKKCWAYKLEDRPTFVELIYIYDKMLNIEFPKLAEQRCSKAEIKIDEQSKNGNYVCFSSGAFNR